MGLVAILAVVAFLVNAVVAWRGYGLFKANPGAALAAISIVVSATPGLVLGLHYLTST